MAWLRWPVRLADCHSHLPTHHPIFTRAAAAAARSGPIVADTPEGMQESATEERQPGDESLWESDSVVADILPKGCLVSQANAQHMLQQARQEV